MPQKRTRASLPQTFDNFIQLPENFLALAVAKHWMKCQFDSPLGIYGPHGSGKTHLLRAIAERNGPTVCRYFRVMDLLDYPANSPHSIVSQLEGASIVLLDDIDCAKGRLKRWIFLGQVLAHVRQRQMRMLVTSTRPVGRHASWPDGDWLIMGLPRNWSGVVEKKLLQYGLSPPDDFRQRLCDYAFRSFADLEGFLLNVKIRVSLTGGYDERIFRDCARIYGEQTLRVSPDEIIAAVSAHFSLPPAALRGRSRVQYISGPRQIAMYLISWLTDLTT